MSIFQKNLVKLQCSTCKNVNYWTRRNKKTVTEKLEMSKYCKHCKQHTIHKEVRK
ncbi:50S ribosomal protein L33 [Patescibacteria group bacterium]|nr:50S ribosomal protein L33 [Patescibacteria group bacterium]